MSALQNSHSATDADVEAVVRVYVRYHKARRKAERLLDEHLKLHGRSSSLREPERQGEHIVPNSSCIYRADGGTIEVRDTESRTRVRYELSPQPGSIRRHVALFLADELKAGLLPEDAYRPFLEDPERWDSAVDKVIDIFDPS
ncbi:hypothetical protein [Calycomorphotria hydatis]|uniref:Uncharacterized protein n=1 Tax=Calycomorphotria hydatis TaxID=2528027 RepID=A0A517TCA0_9PLAN|nr:hypothetical protein [Calycomorphotria hydatis]QDT66008.1 hypothetical protein V22_32720 [Calycomorphotria hydatis]